MCPALENPILMQVHWRFHVCTSHVHVLTSEWRWETLLFQWIKMKSTSVSNCTHTPFRTVKVKHPWHVKKEQKPKPKNRWNDFLRGGIKCNQAQIKNKLPALQKIGVLDNSTPTTVMYLNVSERLQIKVIQSNKKHFQITKKKRKKKDKKN